VSRIDSGSEEESQIGGGIGGGQQLWECVRYVVEHTHQHADEDASVKCRQPRLMTNMISVHAINNVLPVNVSVWKGMP
jgi:hypothetical protein